MFKNIRGDIRVKRNIDVENELHVQESILLGTEVSPQEPHALYSQSEKPSKLNGSLTAKKVISSEYAFNNESAIISKNNEVSIKAGNEDRLTVTESGQVYAKNIHTLDNSTVSDKNKQFITSGVYTPIVLLIENVEDATIYPCHFTRIGQVVTVSGRIDIDVALSDSRYELNISLPIPSTLDGPGSLSGIAKATSDYTSTIAICPDTIDDEARFLWDGQKTVNNKEYYFTFTYLIT